MNIPFKKEYSDGLFSWLYVAEKSITVTSLNNTTAVAQACTLYEKRFHSYISFAGFLTARLKKHVIMRFSPILQESLGKLTFISWKYEVLDSDLYGTGIDKGFIGLGEHVNGISEFEQSCLYPLDNLNKLNEFPEDTFGDTVSHISIFGLTESRTDSLLSLFKDSRAPNLPGFLRAEEIFIHITHGKELPYLSSILIKSKTDIDDVINSFLKATDAGN